MPCVKACASDCQRNLRIFNKLVKLLAENLDLAEKGEYRGGVKIEYSYTETGRLRGVHFNNRLIQCDD